MKTREDALKLLHSWVSNEGLRRHCLCVAASMEEYAKRYFADGKIVGNNSELLDLYWMTGLLHDLDWEKYPIFDQHPSKGCEKLREEGFDARIIESIMGHNDHNPHKVERNSLMAKTLFAVDELSGLVYALAKVRPGNFLGMNSDSVKKAMKKKDFAAAINREDIEKGMEELKIESEEERKEHFETVISALSRIKKDLGFFS